MRIYEVGGCVRDEILGVKSKDIDFTVVLDEGDFAPYKDKRGNKTDRVPEPYEAMERILRDRGFTIYPVKGAKENFTIRGRFPDYSRAHLAVIGNREYSRRDADFVLARVEGPYSDGRRPDWVKVGTLEDDLRRRDFTMNAIAKDPETGEYIDPFGGQMDISDKIIRTVGDPYDRFTEDALRPLRAVRFAVTKGFSITPMTRQAMQDPDVLDLIRNKISDSRKREELNKMFAYDTVKSMRALSAVPALTDAIFSGTVSLEATMKQRKP